MFNYRTNCKIFGLICNSLFKTNFEQKRPPWNSNQSIAIFILLLPALTSSYIFDKKTAENEKQSVAGSNLGSKLRNNKWSERNSSLSKNICTNAHFQIPNSHSFMERFNQIFTPPDTSVITVTQDQYYSINSIKNRAIQCNIIKHHTMPCKLAEHTCICQRVGCNL